MRPKKTSAPAAPVAAAESPLFAYRWMIWLVFFAGSLFLLPQCLDRYLAPRFLFVSAALLFSLLLLWRDLLRHADRRMHLFDGMLLWWYALHLASVFWAFSWSEAVFFTQKVLILLLAYALVQAALRRDEALVRRAFGGATFVLTLVTCAIIAVQAGMSLAQNGIDNDKMYEYVIGVFGNKGLASDFLFVLLVFNVLLYRDLPYKFYLWIALPVMLVLILLLQTRTVYLAVALATAVYCTLRAWSDPAFKPVFLKKILPAALLGVVLLAGFIAWKGRGTTLAERLNPATYLESASANERRFVWYRTRQLSEDHFWLGVGSGSWKFWFPSKNLEGGYRMMEKNIVFTRAHNDYLEIRCEMGIVGGVLYAMLFVVAFCAALYGIRKNTDQAARHDLSVLAAGFAGYWVIQSFDFPRERIEMQVVMGIWFAWTAWHTRALWQLLPGVRTGRFFPLLLVLAAAGLVLNLVVGWNRVMGEIHYVKLFRAHNAGRYPEVLREVKQTENPYFEYNEVGLPICWYEGVALYQTGRFDEAAQVFGRAYERNPWNIQVINNYASALTKKQQFREAIPLYEKALEINPRYDEGKFNLAIAWMQLKDPDKAMEWLEKVDTIPNPPGEEEKRKNKSILEKLDYFKKAVQESRGK